MKKIITYIVFFVSTITFVEAQNDTLNYLDANGKKQGPWKIYHTNGKIKMEGFFKNNTPIGDFKKYHENGQLKYHMYYDKNDTNKVTVTMYDGVGELTAKGEYYAKKRNGNWQYFGSNNTVIKEENYNHGKLNGKSIVFWQTKEKNPMEIKNWKDSLKHGDWIWFYEDGKIRQKAHYTNNKLNGDFNVFFSNGTQHIKGQYVNNTRDGLWEYFEEDGTQKFKIEYSNGKIKNEKEFEIAETKYIDENILNQKGKFADDPQDFINNPEAYIFKDIYPEQETSPDTTKKKKRENKRK